MTFDIVIRNGAVVDGSGSPARNTDVAIRDGAIAAVDRLDSAQCEVTIEADGMVVAPGFIDSHAHSDVMLLADPQHAPKLLQGVTTEVLGQDGLSYAPLSASNLQLYRRYLAGLNTSLDVDWNWSSVAEYRARFDGHVAINTAYLIPHGAIRLEVLGMEDVPLVGEDLRRAQRLVEQGMEEWGVGFSTGLGYYPQVYSDTTELVELCRPAVGGVFAPHLRTIFRGEPFDPVQEALDVSRRSGIALHLTHFGPGWDISMVDRAKADGLDVTFDAYPYFSGSSTLMAFLPPWAQVGGPDDILERLADPVQRKRMEGEVAGVRIANRIKTWGDMMISHAPSAANRHLVGLTIPEATEARGFETCEEFVCQILLEENLEVGHRMPPPPDEVVEAGSEKYMKLLERADYAVSSDSILAGDKPHPRAYGTFPKVLGPLRRRYGNSLESLVNRMTAFPASRFGLSDRGLLRPGKAADVVVFDPDLVNDTATYDEPKSFPEGIEHVLVNGQVAVEEGAPTGVLAGRALP